jgi:hypothetical protein
MIDLYLRYILVMRMTVMLMIDDGDDTVPNDDNKKSTLPVIRSLFYF